MCLHWRSSAKGGLINYVLRSHRSNYLISLLCSLHINQGTIFGKIIILILKKAFPSASDVSYLKDLIILNNKFFSFGISGVHLIN